MYLVYLDAACLCLRWIDIAIINKVETFTQSILLKSVIDSYNFIIFFSTSCYPIIEEKPNLIFLSFIISSMVATTFRILDFGHGVYPISQVICSRMKKQKVRFFSNTWLDIINNFFSCCTTICFDLNEIFLGNSGTCQMFNYITPNMISLFFVGTDLRFNSFLVVICFDLYVELVFFYFFGVYHLISYYLWR